MAAEWLRPLLRGRSHSFRRTEDSSDRAGGAACLLWSADSDGEIVVEIPPSGPPTPKTGVESGPIDAAAQVPPGATTSPFTNPSVPRRRSCPTARCTAVRDGEDGQRQRRDPVVTLPAEVDARFCAQYRLMAATTLLLRPPDAPATRTCSPRRPAPSDRPAYLPPEVGGRQQEEAIRSTVALWSP